MLEVAPESELPPEQPSAPDAEPEPAPIAAEVAEPEPSEEPEAAGGSAEPELMVTETMAEIFLRQGHRELALAVYSQLAQREPGNERVAAAFARLQAELAPPHRLPAEAVEPVAEPRRRYDAAATAHVPWGTSSPPCCERSARAWRPPFTLRRSRPRAVRAANPLVPRRIRSAWRGIRGGGHAAGLPVARPIPDPASPASSSFTPAEGSTAEVQLPSLRTTKR
jgi:hypothetical protein